MKTCWRQAILHPSLPVADFVYIYRTTRFNEDKDLGSSVYGFVASFCAVSSSTADRGAVTRIKATTVQGTLVRKNSCIHFA
jgi:hypothetical protein